MEGVVFHESETPSSQNPNAQFRFSINSDLVKKMEDSVLFLDIIEINNVVKKKGM